MKAARYIMVGGFLGAGKTTALLRLAEKLRAEGKTVGLITNDQSVNLVDTAMLNSHDFPVEEITGGCFCCRFNSLTEAAEKLSADTRPDVFLAEPVGSCTDLTATVAYPLRRLYGDAFTLAPYSVLVDPIRAERILGLAEGKSFSPKVVYIYRKQLEEADVIVVNKSDLLTLSRRAALVAKLESEFPKATVMVISARSGAHFDVWAERLASAEMPGGSAMEVDYDTYAEGEALLGWVNLTVTVTSPTAFDGNGFVTSVATAIHRQLAAEGTEVAHLKMTFAPAEGLDLAVANLVRTDGTLEFSHSLQEPLDVGEFLLNLRAEADPAGLKSAAEGCLQDVASAAGIHADVVHAEAFRPGRPVPTHRFTEA